MARMTEDVYTAFAKRLGTSRAEAKRRTYERVLDMPVQVLAPGEEVPAAVRWPRVERVAEDLERPGYHLRTLEGQRFLIPMSFLERHRDLEGLVWGEVLDRAIREHSVEWIS